MDVVQQVKHPLHVVLTSYIISTCYYSKTNHDVPTGNVKNADLPKAVVEVEVHCSLTVLCQVQLLVIVIQILAPVELLPILVLLVMKLESAGEVDLW